MQTELRQRLVGGVVIVCVLAIFLPVLLHKPKAEQVQPVPMAIPKPATVSEMSLQLPAQSSPQVVSSPTTVADKLAAAQAAVARPAPQLPVQNVAKKQVVTVASHRPINSKILQSAIETPQAWVVQLASFSQRSHANKLVMQLRKQGFDAYSRSSDAGHHHITRVFVGPEIERAKMQQINRKLQHDFHLNGVVRKYNV